MQMRVVALCLCLLIALPTAARANKNAAAQYWLAFEELNARLPNYVILATTDNKTKGFPNALSDQQLMFLELEFVRRIEYRFQKATSFAHCDWQRDYSTDGTAIHVSSINAKATKLARVALLYARRAYENENWSKGNAYVLGTYRLSHDLALQMRPGEHDCYMIRNMARATAGAYILEMPANERDLLAKQITEVPPLLPMRDACYREAELCQWISRSLASIDNEVETDPAEVVLMLKTMVASSDAKRLQKEYSIKDLQNQATGLARLKTKIGDLMRLPVDESDQIYRQKILPEVAQNALALCAISDDTSNWLRREDAQSECRRAMFFAIIDFVRHGDSGLTQHKDPFGTSAFRLQKSGPQDGHILISQLRYGRFSSKTQTWNGWVILAFGRTANHALVE